MAQLDAFLGTDTQGNPITDSYYYHGDAKYTARSEDAARQFDWNMMNYQNWWNSPELQVARLEQAGLNPLFYLGGNAGTTPAAAGGNLQGHQMTTSDGKLGQIIDASKNVADSLLDTQKQALDYDIQRRLQEIDLRRVKVEEGRLGNETRKTGQEVEESQSRIKFNEAQIDRLGKENEWTDQQIAQAQVEMAKMNKEMEAIDVLMQEAGSRIDLNQATIRNLSHLNKVLDAQVSELAARTGLEKQQVETEIAKIADFQASADLKTAEIEVQKGQKVVLEKTAEGIEIKNEQDKTYGGWERTQGIISGYIHTAAEAVNTVINVKTGGAKAALDKAKREFVDKQSEAVDQDNYERASMSGKTEEAYQEALDRRAEAKYMLDNKALDGENRDYWQKEYDYWTREARAIERSRSGNTHVNPTYDFGN